MSKVTRAGQRAAKMEEPAVSWVQAAEEKKRPCAAHRLCGRDLRSPVTYISFKVILLQLSLIAK